MERMDCGGVEPPSDAEMRSSLSDADQATQPKDADQRPLVNSGKLAAKIRAQLEFYFSDSNLSKDRFLLNEIRTNSQDGFVDLALFLRFNKIASLTNDVAEIARAVQKSTTLELDASGAKVKRRVDYVPPSQADMDNRTVYAENVFGDADRIKRLFAKYGKVAYVSVPKFKTSSQTKGFAFVEFEEEKAARECIQSLSANLAAHQVTGKFPKTHVKIADLEKKIARVRETIRSFETPELSEEADAESRPGKRKTADSDAKEPTAAASNEEEPTSKERKLEEEPTESGDKKSQKTAAENLLVISKADWLAMKEDYLKKQREQIDALKAELERLNELAAHRKEERLKAQNERVKTDDVVRGSIVKVAVDFGDEEQYKLFKLSRAQFKEQKLKAFEEHVAYVDLDKSSCKIFVRCKSRAAAELVLQSADFMPGFGKQLLSADEEEAYFARIFANRSKKLDKKDKKQQQGPSEPIKVAPAPAATAPKPSQPTTSAPPAAKKSTHIKFDEDDDDN